MKERTALTAFHFRVSYEALAGDNGSDSQFISVSGLKALLVPPSAETTNKEKPVVQYNPVLLRRAVISGKTSPLRKWILKSLAKPGSLLLPSVQIEVLNEEHEPEMVFVLRDVSAAGWEMSELNAGKSELLTEDIYLQYKGLTIQ